MTEQLSKLQKVAYDGYVASTFYGADADFIMASLGEHKVKMPFPFVDKNNEVPAGDCYQIVELMTVAIGNTTHFFGKGDFILYSYATRTLQ